MIEGGDRLRLALEATAPIGIGRHRGRQDLERYPTAQLGVLGDVDLAHAAPPDGAGDAVVGDRLAGL